ncbi:MAG: peptidoglycan-binding protein [Thermoleophilaceae bacterium]|nr:peptidoglycan-binding protein [Thermoleophilaceae bacterium]
MGMALVVALPQAASGAETNRGRDVLARGAGFGTAHGSPAVERLQRNLSAAGLNPGNPDGLYGPRTARAVRRFQADRGLKVDGLAGPRTRAALAAAAAAGREAAAPPAPAPTARPRRPVPEPAAAAPAPAAEEGGAGLPWTAYGGALAVALAAIGLVAGLLVRMGVPLPGRRGPGPAVVPLGQGLEIAGESRDPGIGRFSGVAYAVEIPDVRDPARRAQGSRFYVIEPGSPHPFWVRYAEVHSPLPPALQALQPGAAVLGYVTVPKTGPERHAELFAQIELIEAHCKRRGLRLMGVVRDEDPAEQGPLERPGLAYALEQFASDEASALVVSHVSRLGRSRSEIDELLGRLSGRGVSLLALEPGLDTAPAPDGVPEAAPVPRRVEPFARRMRRRSSGKAAAQANGGELVGAAER